MKTIEVKRLHVIIPLDLFLELRRTGILHEIDEIITRQLYGELERREKNGRRKD